MTPTRHHVPTPWINAVHPLTQAQYKFRLSRTRMNGKITIALARDSPTAQAQTRCVQPGRTGWWEFVSAAVRLLETAELDPRVNPDSAAARSQWNTDKRDYATHTIDVTTVLSLLPQLLDPKHHPLKQLIRESVSASARNGGTNVSHVAARTNRYREIMDTCYKLTTTLRPIRDRMQDARKMKGYTAEETTAMLTIVDSIHISIEKLSRMARTNSFKHEAAAPALRNTNLNDPQPFVVEDEVAPVPLSAGEQSIAREQAFTERLATERKTTFAEDLEAFEKTFVPPAPRGFQIDPP